VTPRVITALRALDGPELQRGQHRRRHRARALPALRSLLRQAAQTAWPAWRRVAGAARLRCRTRNEPGGSNGIAIAPANTVGHHALLLINPHTSFFFRSELQVTSDEGLNAYGAVTWGQFFIYQGFNERAGWMHTSTGVDNVDFFAETIVNNDGRCSIATARPSGR
jgi:acyl-homoserine lactone acylase PvdQ